MTYKPDRPLFLCGMMGSGKSTVGKALAGRISIPFYDLDEEIEQEQNCSIPVLFSERGEEYFRAVERDLLLRKAAGIEGVLALGGGALQDHELTDYLKTKGWLIFLDAPVSVILNRLKADGSRPMLQVDGSLTPEQRIGKLLTERRPLYSRAHITVNIVDQPPVEIAETILEKLNRHER